MPESSPSWGDITGWTGSFNGTYTIDQKTTNSQSGHTSVQTSATDFSFSSTLNFSKRTDDQSWQGSATVTARKVEKGTLKADGNTIFDQQTETTGTGAVHSGVGLVVFPDAGNYSFDPGSVDATEVVTTDGVTGEATPTNLAFPSGVTDLIQKQPLPKTPGPISGSVAGGHEPSGETWSMTWSLTPNNAGPMTVDIAVNPAKPKRGQRVMLKAVVKNAVKKPECEWSFEALPGHTIAADAGDTGVTTSICAIEDVVVKLKVADGDRVVTATKTVTIAPRRMKTAVKKAIDDTEWDAGHILIESGRYGVTHCAACDGSHAIHHESKDWSDVVTTAQVDDEGGPHHGFWWVSEARLASQLVCHVNSYLRSAELEDFDGQKKSDVLAIQRQVRDHEHAHATVSAKAVKALDPGPKLEELVAPPTASDFATQAQAVADAAEQAIWEKTCDEAAAKALLTTWAHPGHLWLKSALGGDVEYHTYPSMQDIGGG